MPVRPCLVCGESEMHQPPTSATIPGESLVAPCSLCEGPRNSHDFLDMIDERTGETKRYVRLCHSCRSAKPGTLGAAFVTLMTGAASTEPLRYPETAPVAAVRNLALQFVGANEFTRSVWDQLVRLLKSRGKRPKRLRNAKTGVSVKLPPAYATSLREVVGILREEIQARSETPVVEGFSETWTAQPEAPKEKAASIDNEPEAIRLDDCSDSVVFQSQEPAPSGAATNAPLPTAAAPSESGRESEASRNPLPVDLVSVLKRRRATTQATFVEFMMSRVSASFEEIAERVHGDSETEDATIRQLVKRVNESMSELKLSTRYASATSRVFKEVSPE